MAIYTTGGPSAEISEVWEDYIHPYFAGSFHASQFPDISFSFTPYTAVINMRDGTLIAKDEDGAFLNVQQILDAVNQANQ